VTSPTYPCPTNVMVIGEMIKDIDLKNKFKRSQKSLFEAV